MCKVSNDRARFGGSGGGEGSKRQPEAAQFDTFESCTYEVTIGEELPESMMVVVDIVGEDTRGWKTRVLRITSSRLGRE